MGRQTYICIPPKYIREIAAKDHPEACTPKCTLWAYPVQCRKSNCQLTRIKDGKK